jgi:hypothetical protein
MSGPIVRKYGFPNFEKIFGERPIQHGADESESTETGTGLPPDLPHTDKPTNPNAPSSAGKIAPATEFGSAVE